MGIRKTAEKAIRLYRLIESGQGVVAAVSGGADSVALLLCLHSLAPELGFSLYAAHLHHGIRGASADEDMAFVEALCERLSIPLYVQKRDVPALAEAAGQGLEEAGREARYAFLEEARLHFGASRIALAHHLDDQAESVLLHLFRGSGLAGLCGMRARRCDIIRPLLFARREDIEAYLADQGQPWRADETNLLVENGTRNRLRLELLPYIQKNINPEIVSSLAGSAELLALDEDYLFARAREELDAARRGPGYDRALLHALPPALRGRALRLALAQAAGVQKDVEKRHIALLTKLLEARTGAHLDLPGAAADIVYENLILTPARAEREQPFFRLPLALEGETETPMGVFTAEAYEGPLIKDPAIAIMDADKLPEDMWVRPRRPGDRFFLLGAPGQKKLKAFFIDRKVPRAEREIPIVFCGENALFVPGFGISEGVKVDAATRRMLRVTYRVNQ
ncbi:MAG: tRNA lysidine(34) synthetase TilS [Candidatus Pelethousia sp.]|nr:tRNA lysidine(34) synthetase TilS [Candidatus Pelethousia sp.]